MPRPSRAPATRRRPADPARRRATLIRRSLCLAGVSQAAIGRRCGVTRGMVCHVVGGRKRSPKVERALARAINLTTRELWED